jgi:alpha-soluble NSF attachment protein
MATSFKQSKYARIRFIQFHFKIFEEVGDKYMENKLTAPSAKELYFKASLLYLCNDDSVGCANALEKFVDKDPSFSTTRQFKFVQQLIKAVDTNDVQIFSEEW